MHLSYLIDVLQMCFLGFFCAEGDEARSAADGTLSTELDNNSNSTFILSTIFDLREAHSAHFSDIKLLLVVLLTILIVSVGLFFLLRPRRNPDVPDVELQRALNAPWRITS